MSNEIFQAIEQVGREKGIEVDIIIQAVEDAYAAAAKKYFRTKEDLGARFDRDTGSLAVFARKKIVDDVTNPDLEIYPNEAEEMTLPANEEGIVEIPKPKEELAQLGRIAAQAAKQIIFQKVREAERDNVYKEYIGRAGELVNGVVKRFERGSIIIDLGRTEGILPKKEQSKAERYSQGDRVRAVIVDVDRNAKGPQVILSRTDERLLIKLFEMEVPEIYDGTVQIERAVHDPGDRAKVAVRSKDRDVDPVGACVGKKGQNVRLASRLAGWKIDIKSEQEKKREVQAEMERMARDAREMAGLEGVSEKLVQKLQEGGVQSLDAITAFGIDGLTNVPGVGPKTAEKILAAAQAGLQARAELEEAERIEAERLAAEEAARQSEEQARLAEEAAAEEAARQAAESAAEAPAASAEDDEATEVGAEPSETDEDAAGPAAEEAATPHGETLDSTAGERREGD